MGTVRSINTDLSYLKELVGAGWDGIASARQEIKGGVFTPPLQTVIWTPAAIGATIGLLSTCLAGNRKSASRMAMAGLVGSVVGFSAALAWASRRFTGPAARRAVRQVNLARDAHWLEANPITYA